jgi:hypothetical protein
MRSIVKRIEDQGLKWARIDLVTKIAAAFSPTG